MSSAESVVIVGASHAGAAAAAFLRLYDFAGQVTLIGEETVLPYHRPPLSKAWPTGKMHAEVHLLRANEFYRDNKIALRLGLHVESIDRCSQSIRLRGGEKIYYDRLILATGRRARQLSVPGVELSGVFELRTSHDADRLRAALTPRGKHLVVVGGGYIGLEAAASARAIQADVTVIERESRVLARVACETLSAFFQAYHRAKGVELELGTDVEAIEGNCGQVTGVRLFDKRLIEADAVLVGVGAIANDELAANAGLECRNGILVDLSARTVDPSIFAIGDCSRRPLPFYNRVGHLESVQNALEQAKQAASSITERPPPPHEVPWFWSDQYDLKLQIAGLPHDATQKIIRGNPTSVTGASFAVFHLNADCRLQAVEAINAPAEFMGGKQLISSRRSVHPAKLSDPSLSMKEVIA